MTNKSKIYRVVTMLGVFVLSFQPAHSENKGVLCQNAFTIQGIKFVRAASNFIERLSYSPGKQKRRQLLKWGETQLGREFTDREIKVFMETQFTILPQSWRNEIFREVRFSESERQKLLRAPQLTEPIKEIMIELPEKTDEAQRLKGEGFNSAYIRGIDEANEWIAIAEQLRTEEVDPYITHVGYFYRKTMEHIQHLEKGVEDPELRKRFLKWRKYVEKKQKNKNFTYEDWLKVNWALAQISEYKEIYKGDWAYKDIDTLIHVFPKEIAVPTTIGRVGIETLNRAGSHGIHTIGLGYGIEGLFGHDLRHAVTATYPPVWYYNKIKELSENFPIRKRENIKLGYWFTTHEDDFEKRWVPSSVEKIKRFATVPAIKGELKGLMDISSAEKIDQRMEEVIQDFMEIFVLAKRKEASQH